MISLILIAILVVLLCWFCYQRTTYWERKNIPFVPMKIQNYFGSISSETHKAIQFHQFCKNHPNEPIIGIFMFSQPAVVINDPEIARSIQTENFDHFQNRGMFYNDPLSAILGSLDYEPWKPLRKKLTPAFTPAKIKNMFNTIKIVGDEVQRGLGEILLTNNQVEVRDLFGRFTTDVIASVAIGINPHAKLREMATKAMQKKLMYPLNILTEAFPKFSRFLNIRKHSKEVTDFFLDIVEQSIELRRQTEVRRNDYLQLLIDADIPKGQIAPLVFDFLSAGYADSTSTLAYCLYELALPENWHIQIQAREEIHSILEENDGQLSYEALEKMIFCKQIVKETLRKHPVAGNSTRIANKPYKVPNTDITIPKGMRAYIPIYAFHHDERFYKNPEEFDPERFSEDNENAARTFLGFGDGKRKCIGSEFAKVLITTGLVSLLRSFQFSTCKRTQVPIQYSSTKNTLIPSDGVWLEVDRI